MIAGVMPPDEQSKDPGSSIPGAKALIEVGASLLNPGLGAVAKLAAALDTSVRARFAREKAERHDRFVRALLATGEFASVDEPESPPGSDLFTAVYQLVLLDEESEKAELGARLIAAFKTGRCPVDMRPILVRLLRELPLGAIRLLEVLENAWQEALVEGKPRAGKPEDSASQCYELRVRSTKWDLVSAQQDITPSSMNLTYRSALVSAGALMHKYHGSDPEPVMFPFPSPLGRLLLKCTATNPTAVGMHTASPWRSTSGVTRENLKSGPAIARRLEGGNVREFVGHIYFQQDKGGKDHFTAMFKRDNDEPDAELAQFSEFREISVRLPEPPKPK